MVYLYNFSSFVVTFGGVGGGGGRTSHCSIFFICNSSSVLNIVFVLNYIIRSQPTQEGSRNHEAYLLFPVHLDGTLLDNSKAMKAKKEVFSTSNVLHIFRQVNKITSFFYFSPYFI